MDMFVEKACKDRALNSTKQLTFLWLFDQVQNSNS